MIYFTTPNDSFSVTSLVFPCMSEDNARVRVVDNATLVHLSLDRKQHKHLLFFYNHSLLALYYQVLSICHFFTVVVRTPVVVTFFLLIALLY